MNGYQQLLFLCTGNYYRSRHAEIVFNHLARQYGVAWRAVSRGFQPHLAREPFSHYVEQRLAELSIPSREPPGVPKRVTRSELAHSALVIAMNRPEHEPMIRSQFPEWSDRVQFWEIADLDILSPYQALPHIEAKVEWLIAPLVDGHALGCSGDVLVEF